MSGSPSVSSCADLIRAGHLVAFPTETVYGLGADAAQDAAVAKIFAAKGRPSDHPLIVHVSGLPAAQRFATELPDFALKLIEAFWPGPLTIIVPRQSGIAAGAAGGQSSIGLRCPSHPMALELLRECEMRGVYGIAAPSANRFGKVSPTTAAHVIAELGTELAVLDGGACPVGIESSIVDCTRGAPVLLRPGVLTHAEIETALGQKLLLNQELLPRVLPGNLDDLAFKNRLLAPKSSGSLESHYAPAAKLRLMDAKSLQTALDVLGNEAQHIAVYARTPLHIRCAQTVLRRMPQDALAAAQQLFAALRELDAPQTKLIWVEHVPDAPEWDGVRDRLSRAAH